MIKSFYCVQESLLIFFLSNDDCYNIFIQEETEIIFRLKYISIVKTINIRILNVLKN